MTPSDLPTRSRWPFTKRWAAWPRPLPCAQSSTRAWLRASWCKARRRASPTMPGCARSCRAKASASRSNCPLISCCLPSSRNWRSTAPRLPVEGLTPGPLTSLSTTSTRMPAHSSIAKWRRAVSISGRSSSMTASRVIRLVRTDRLSAAITSPAALRTGTAIERSPISSSSSLMA